MSFSLPSNCACNSRSFVGGSGDMFACAAAAAAEGVGETERTERSLNYERRESGLLPSLAGSRCAQPPRLCPSAATPRLSLRDCKATVKIEMVHHARWHRSFKSFIDAANVSAWALSLSFCAKKVKAPHNCTASHRTCTDKAWLSDFSCSMIFWCSLLPGRVSRVENTAKRARSV